MKTTDLFKFNRSSKRINESIDKVFGKKLNLETFDTTQLEDARNKLRTQIHSARSESGFNETIENEALTQAQWMHDAIVAELIDRQEHIVDTTVQEESKDKETVLGKIADEEDYDALYDLMSDIHSDAGKWVQSQIEDITLETGLHPDDDFEEIENRLMDRIVSDFGEGFGQPDDEGGETDDAYALASAGHGSDEDYGFAGHDESIAMERDRDPEDWDEGNTEPPNNFAIYINGKKWKVLHGQGTYADDHREMAQLRRLQDMCRKKTEQTGKKWEVSRTGETATESIEEKAPPGAKAERMVKHIKKGYAKDGKLTDKEKGIAYATAWKQHNKEKNESINTGEDMHNLREGEIQQASAIVTAKTMVDRVGRWIEELSGMENDTLLTLGDSIRDEMGAEQAKTFISACAPAIQAALENLKSTREALSSSVRALTGEEQGAEMLGGEPGAEGDLGADLEAPAEPDAMNAGGDEFGAAPEDDFGAAEPAAGGLETAGREKRESIDRSNQLLRVLAG